MIDLAASAAATGTNRLPGSSTKAVENLEGRMNILVAFATKHGSTADIAGTIASELQALGHTCDLRHFSEAPGASQYDAVVLGSAVYMGNWLPEASRFVERNLENLSRMPVWMFSSGPLGDPPVPVERPAGAEALANKITPREHHIFAGRLDPHDLGLGERLATKMVKAPSGDFRKWDEIRDWARAIGEELSPAGNLACRGSR